MKLKRYSLVMVMGVLISLLITDNASAQRGRYYGGNRGYHRSFYPHRSYAYNRPFVSVNFNSLNYRYQRGYFYRPYGSVLRVSIPPFGVRISTLPVGYRSLHVGPNPYYYYEGTYYRNNDRQYEVVAPPLGAVVDNIPAAAKVKVIDGQKYYELDGTYYQEEITADNRLQYTVVGTDGVLNTKDGLQADTPQIGDRYDVLPADAKAVVINGEKLYTSASGFYYKEVIEGDKVFYEIVGK